MAELGRASGEQFARGMCARVAELSPPLAAVATGAGVRRFVDRGLEAAAAAFNLKNSESLRFFIETGVVLGHRFFEDPQYPWVAKTLNDRSLETEDARIGMLSRYLFDYLDEVFGPGNAYAVRALRELDRALPARVDDLPVADCEGTLGLLRRWYPEKFSFVGPEQLRLVFQAAGGVASRFALPERQAGSCAFGLLVAFGIGMEDDPLYPWIGSILSGSAEGRLSHLYDRARAYLRRVSAHLEGK